MRSRGAEGLALDGVTGAHVVRPVRTQDGDSLGAATVGVNRHDRPGISGTDEDAPRRRRQSCLKTDVSILY